MIAMLFGRAPIPSNETARLQALQQYHILDTAPEAVFDDLTRLATHICQTPTALISLIDAKRQWFKAKVGLEACETDRDFAFCAHAILSSELFVVRDALTDERFADNPLVTADPKIRFYAGAPLITPEGMILGTLCVIDYVPRELTPEQQEALKALSRQVMSQLELRRGSQILSEVMLERQQVEEEQNRFFSISLDMLCIASFDGFFKRLSPVWEKTLGFRTQELISKPFVDFVHPDDREATLAIAQTLVSGEEVLTFENRYRCRDGAYRWLSWKATSLVEQQLIYATARDVTDHKRAEMALQESEQQYRSVVDSVKEVIFQLNTEGYWTFLNSAWTEVTGFSLGESIGTNLLDCIHPDDRQPTWGHLQQLMNGQQDYSCQEFRCLTSDNSYRWLEMCAQLTFHGSSAIASISGTLNDIHERKQTEQALQKSNDRVIKILESITDAFFILDRDWCFSYLNSRAEQILFRARAELLGQPVWQEFPEFIGSTFYQEAHRAIADQVTVHFEEFYTPLGIWLEVRAYPYDDGLSVYFRDATARKQAEVDLLERSHLSTLEAEVSIALGQSTNLPEVLERCMDAMVEHLGVAFARIWTFDRETNFLELQAIAGQHAHTEDFQSRIPLGISIIGFIAQTLQPYCTNDVANDVCIGAKDWAAREQMVGFAGYPLVVENRLVGVLALFSRYPLTETAYSVLSWIVNAIAVAIDRAWAREELLSRREALLFRLASQIRNSLDLDTILGTAVQEIRSLLKIDRCHFLWYFPNLNHHSLAITHEAREPDLPSLLGDCPPQQMGFLSEKIQQVQTIQIDSVANESEIDPETQATLTQLGITSQLLLPLETRSGQLGAIVCSHCSGPRPWSPSEVELLQAVTDQLAIAIDQAELYAQTHAAAFAAQTQAQQLSEALQTLKQTQTRLIQNEKMSSLGQMVAGIAHEINNPVTFINGNLSHASNYTQDLLRLLNLYQQYYPSPVPEIQEEAEAIDLEFVADDLPKLLSSMKMGADRIRQIVLSLRNFSRLDEAEMKPVDIHEGIDNTLLILQNRLKPNGQNSGIQIIKEYGNLPAVECYAGQLNQVFMNILSNAIDALDEQPDPRIITIGTEVITERNQSDNKINAAPPYAVIRIRDNGPGIPEAIEERLFDPFFTTKPVGKGTGLGLSISYQVVVERHEGILKCTSEPGQGSEFLIQIPVNPSVSPS